MTIFIEHLFCIRQKWCYSPAQIPWPGQSSMLEGCRWLTAATLSGRVALANGHLLTQEVRPHSPCLIGREHKVPTLCLKWGVVYAPQIPGRHCTEPQSCLAFPLLCSLLPPSP